MRLGRLLRALFAVMLFGAVLAAPTHATAGDCASTIDAAKFTDTRTLRTWNQVMADLGPRPTASPTHERYIDWIERQLKTMPGLELSSLDETIDRQLEQQTTLQVTDAAGVRHDVPVAGAVPYTRPGTESGALTYLPAATPISDADAGKIVVRDAAPGSIPMAAFFAVAWYLQDTNASFSYTGNYERDWIGVAQRITDLQAAQDHDVAGIVFVHGLPRAQVEGQYAPYTGQHWGVTGAYVGADEGALLQQWAQTGAAKAELTLRATRGPAKTRTIRARLEGQSPERIVIQSHTDGMNAVWDNGPTSILALADYFTKLPLSCRPRSIEFLFTTGHLHLSHSGASRYATELDKTYDQGDTAFVVALEHLGAMEFAPVARTDGGPGRTLERTGRSELFATFASESPALVGAMTRSIQAHNLERTWLLRGADAPAVAFPPHRSYGGEGGPYREHRIPTVAGITGPWTLFDPSFGLSELIDFDLMRRQTLAFGDVVVMLGGVPQQVIAGADPAYRIGHSTTGL